MRFLCMALAVGMASSLLAVDGTLLAQSGGSPAFAVYSVDGATYGAATSAEIAALPPVFSCAGETVTATSPGGGVTTLASPSLVSVLNAGGIWTLVNSVQGSAFVGVAWAVYDDGGTLASGAASESYGVDSKQQGPDRKVKLTDLLPVAYSGDDWVGDATAAATLTFVSPDGAETTLDLAGTGATTQFRFTTSGNWMVTLTMTDGSTRTAVISICGGFVIRFA